ncbi:MAG: hypothetical protein LBM67_03245 [Lentimicrobiaceae bacterium]|jgi:hypothetical protein|nr:hypothetical protein [Lentimicrobiaceae bacterium]
MNILVLLDTKFEIDKKKLEIFFSLNCRHINFKISNKTFSFSTEFISDPESFEEIHNFYGSELDGFDSVFFFTDSQYYDNYFFHEHKDLLIFSFAYWSLLTDLPKSNGLIYFVVDCLVLGIDTTDFRHDQITGCIYDFLEDKRGIDAGMRQARLCPNCLARITDFIVDENTQGIFDDLKILMNLLSSSSKWNKDVFENVEISQTTLKKRRPKSDLGINVVIASPGDTQQERKYLLDTLERKFRTDGHEEHCGFRILVNGWEDLASQNGYTQDVINEKLIEESDFVVSIFKHKLGTPTFDQQTGVQRAESGTVEELLKALDNSKLTHPIGMSYFYSTAPVISLDTPDFETIKDEWEKLKEFKTSISTKIIYKPYTETTELLNMILKDLEQNIT